MLTNSRSALSEWWKLYEPSFLLGHLPFRNTLLAQGSRTTTEFFKCNLYSLNWLLQDVASSLYNIRFRIKLKIASDMKTYLCPQVIVKKFQCCQLFIHSFGIICLLFLYNLPSCLDDSFNLQFHLTEGLIEFLKTQICILVINL